MAKEKLEAALLRVVQDHLRPGETVETVTDGLVNLRLRLPIGGFLALALIRARHGLVLTDQRLFIVGISDTKGEVQDVVAAYPRTDLRALSAPKGLLFKGFHVADRTGRSVVKLSFAIPRRPAGRQIAAALGAAA